MPSIFTEYYNGMTGLTVGVNKVLFSHKSDYQLVEVMETDTWGNLLTIDGMVMLSEKDEFVYHEMLVHVGMFTHPEPERILIIGGGDGGTAREVLRHPSVVEVDLVEIDKTVVEASKKHLPEVGDWDNPKLNVLYKDGIGYVAETPEKYDIIIIDGSDPVGPAEGLFEPKFFRSCHRAMAEDGVLAIQTESPWIPHYHKSIKQVKTSLEGVYDVCNMYLAFIPLYPAGMWSFCLASKGMAPLTVNTMDRIDEGLELFGDKLQYYNKEIHIGSFALPNFVRDIIE